MNEEKPVLEISAWFDNLDQIKELLPQIEALQKTYVVELKVIERS